MTQVYYPSKKTGFIWGIILLVLASVPLIVLLITLDKAQFDSADKAILSIILIVILFLIALFIYFLYALKTLSYQIDADSVKLKWGSACFNIPMSAILDARKITGPMVGFRTFGGSWPGCHFGFFRFRDYGQVEVYSTRLTGDLVLLRTTTQTYLISPEDVDGFLALMHERMEQVAHQMADYLADGQEGKDAVGFAGTTAAASAAATNTKADSSPGAATAKTTGFNQPVSFFRDPIAIVLVAANIALLAAVFIYLIRLVPTLPEKIPAHWDLAGNINRYGNREELYMMPAVGALTAALPLVMGFSQRGKNRKILYISAVLGLLLQVLFISILGAWIEKLNLM
jgi:hypothetical protein